MAQNPTGFSQDAAAARSASFHRPMNPRNLQNVLRNHLARMLPIHDYQGQVYALAQKYPPGFEDGFTPIWECATALLPALKTTQLRINFQREFHLIAVAGSSQQAGGFRVQIFDTLKQYDPNAKPGVRLAGRGVNFATFLGTGFNPANPTNAGSSPFMMRDPYCFAGPDAQALVIIQNQDTGGASNNIQVVLYGVARRFNWPD